MQTKNSSTRSVVMGGLNDRRVPPASVKLSGFRTVSLPPQRAALIRAPALVGYLGPCCSGRIQRRRIEPQRSICFDPLAVGILSARDVRQLSHEADLTRRCMVCMSRQGPLASRCSSERPEPFEASMRVIPRPSHLGRPGTLAGLGPRDAGPCADARLVPSIRTSCGSAREGTKHAEPLSSRRMDQQPVTIIAPAPALPANRRDRALAMRA